MRSTGNSSALVLQILVPLINRPLKSSNENGHILRSLENLNHDSDLASFYLQSNAGLTYLADDGLDTE